MVNASSVNSTAGPALASTMAALVANAQGASTANASITVNGGPTATIGGSPTGSGGTASAANACYCPSGTAPAVIWGAAATCGSACGGGGYAGKFVLVQASHAYTPILSGFGFVQSGQITSSSMARVAMKTIRALLRCRRGATAVEFGLIAAPLMLMLFGVTETARFYWTTASLQSAAQQTARCMAVPDPACATSGAYSAAQAQTYLVSLASADGVTLTANEITLSNAATCGGASGFSTVSINYKFQTVVPLVMTPMAAGLPIQQTACFPNLA